MSVVVAAAPRMVGLPSKSRKSRWMWRNRPGAQPAVIILARTLRGDIETTLGVVQNGRAGWDPIVGGRLRLAHAGGGPMPSSKSKPAPLAVAMFLLADGSTVGTR